MRRLIPLRKKQDGLILVMALSFMVIIMVVGIIVIQISLQSLTQATRHSYTQIAHTASKGAIDYAEEAYELNSAYNGTAEFDLYQDSRYRVTLEVEVIYNQGSSAKRIRAYGRVYLPETAATAEFVREIQASIIRNGEIIDEVDPSDFDPVFWLDASEPNSLYKSVATPNTQYIDGLAGTSYYDIVEEAGSDAYYSSVRGDISASSSDLEMAWNGSYYGTQWIGLRFRGVNAPNSTTVQDAYIQFTTDETKQAGSVDFRVHGVDADNPGTWSGGYAVSNSTKTTANTDWTPPNWNVVGASGTTERVDVTSIVQELVDRSGWTPGNAMAFAVEWIQGSGIRTAESGTSHSPPQLYIEWASGGGSNELATAEGDSVVQWNDKSLNNNDFSLQFGTAPTLTLNAINGIDAVRFANASVLGVNLASVMSGSETTAFIVMKPNTATQTYGAPLTAHNSSQTYDSDNPDGFEYLYKDNTTTDFAQWYDGSKGEVISGAIDGNWAIYTSRLSDNYVERLLKNGAENYSSTHTNVDYDFNQFYLGGRRVGSSSAYHTDMDVAEVVVFNQALVCGDLNDLEAYFSTKYSISVTTKTC